MENTSEKEGEIISFLAEDPIENEIDKENEIDFDLRDVNDQVSEIQKEASSFIFKTIVKASSLKEYSNDTIAPSQSLDIDEESLYAFNQDEICGRKISLLKNLNIKLGKLNS